MARVSAHRCVLYRSTAVIRYDDAINWEGIWYSRRIGIFRCAAAHDRPQANLQKDLVKCNIEGESDLASACSKNTQQAILRYRRDAHGVGPSASEMTPPGDTTVHRRAVSQSNSCNSSSRPPRILPEQIRPSLQTKANLPISLSFSLLCYVAPEHELAHVRQYYPSLLISLLIVDSTPIGAQRANKKDSSLFFPGLLCLARHRSNRDAVPPSLRRRGHINWRISTVTP